MTRDISEADIVRTISVYMWNGLFLIFGSMKLFEFTVSYDV